MTANRSSFGRCRKAEQKYVSRCPHIIPRALIMRERPSRSGYRTACLFTMANSTETPLRVLVVDDEALIRQSLCRGLETRDDVEIVGECESRAQAIAAIGELHPDLVLLDVQMHDGTGLDVVERVGPEHMPAVVFVTAYDDYAVKAFELSAVDYLLKPFDDDRLNRSIDRAKTQIL